MLFKVNHLQAILILFFEDDSLTRLQIRRTVQNLFMHNFCGLGRSLKLNGIFTFSSSFQELRVFLVLSWVYSLFSSFGFSCTLFLLFEHFLLTILTMDTTCTPTDKKPCTIGNEHNERIVRNHQPEESICRSGVPQVFCLVGPEKGNVVEVKHFVHEFDEHVHFRFVRPQNRDEDEISDLNAKESSCFFSNSPLRKFEYNN
jgi:hypothetical protein